MKIPLDQLEARLQALIEGSVARLFPIVKNQEDLASHLINAMRTNIHPQENGRVWAPNLYILSCHPAQAQLIQNQKLMLDELSKLLEQAGKEAGMEFPSAPTILLEAEADLGLHETRIVAQFVLDQAGSTSVMRPAEPAETSTAPSQAYLIVDGSQIYPLSRGVVNIGRSPNNELVLPDRRVSRTHAQLRLVNGRFVIFDLNSTGGTFVNDHRVRQIALYPGDVISLAGVPLVYGQDTSSSSGETQPMPSHLEGDE
jgi:hypothetical protein